MQRKYFSINERIVLEEQAMLPAADKGLTFGWGLFETIRLYEGIPFMFYEHMERLATSCNTFGITLPYGKENLYKHVIALIKTAGIQNEALKIIVTKGSTDLPAVIISYRSVLYKKEDYIKGFTTTVTPIRRNTSSPLTYLKTLNYMDNILARQQALNQGFNEALFLNHNNKLCEGSVSNVFFIKDGKLYTPDTSCGLLPGVARLLVIGKLAPKLNIDVFQGEYDLKMLKEADEAFITNSLLQVMPLVSIDSTIIGNGNPGEITKAFMEAYHASVSQYAL